MPTRALALLTAALVAALMVLGGVVHATESSLACPDWPTCHGEWTPEMVGGVRFEHSHRLLGALVGGLTIALAGLLWRRGGAERAAGVGVLALVVAQGLLGALTVRLELPPAVSTAHLATAFGCLALVLWIARPAVKPTRAPASVEGWTGLAAALVWAQSVLGAVVRHTDAGTACGVDPIRCAGQWAPAWDLGRLQMLHRGIAVVVMGVVVIAVVRVVRAPSCQRLRPLAFVALCVVLAQVGLGVLSVTTALDEWVVTLHLAGGVGLFAAMLWLRLAVRRPAVRRTRPRAA